ncbi:MULTISPECIES: STAS domain-containing protein [Streptomyces]|uniref:Sulfate transporter/antisigma-factor antagonist STAS n=1 Tax=Streptomyces malaysiensis TaxID=92644 RepID=A0A7X5XC04_STRMQ|nr:MULTISPECIES: STAS domain-containing protein [Streptomyces]MCD9594135.1 STAS domain-containing protein [Streptomyces sp. 8ZJF_21]NIY70437.1 sulfate transporter/antisigma-factor antagonist STAS [Streptomyces malaysiensis]
MAGPEPENPPTLSPAVLVLDQPVTRAQVERLCERLSALARRAGPGPVTVDVGGVGRPDLAVVEALARLRLTAGRLGCRIQLRNARGELRRLLAWTGLDEALAAPAALGGVLGSERGGEAEQREEALGVEEGVEPGDPAP